MLQFLKNIYDRITLYGTDPDSDADTRQWEQITTAIIILNFLIYLILVTVAYIFSLLQTETTNQLVTLIQIFVISLFLLALSVYFLINFLPRYTILSIILGLNLGTLYYFWLVLGTKSGIFLFVFPLIGMTILFFHRKATVMAILLFLQFLLVFASVFIFTKLQPLVFLPLKLLEILRWLILSITIVISIVSMVFTILDHSIRHRLLLFWQRLSNMGIPDGLSTLEKKNHILSNQLILITIIYTIILNPFNMILVGAIGLWLSKTKEFTIVIPYIIVTFIAASIFIFIMIERNRRPEFFLKHFQGYISLAIFTASFLIISFSILAQK